MTHRQRRDLVRSFVLTGGRAQPTSNADSLDVVTMVTAVPGKPVTGLQPEQQAMIDLCRGGYLSVVEVAGHLGQPLTITRILIGDLLEFGLLKTKSSRMDPATSPATGATTPDPDHLRILERMLHGLQAL